jgi:hypothetical protein
MYRFEYANIHSTLYISLSSLPIGVIVRSLNRYAQKSQTLKSLRLSNLDMHKLTKPEKKTKRKRHPVQATGSWKPRKKNGQRDAQPEGLWGWVSQAILENEKKSASVPRGVRRPQTCVPRRHKTKRHRIRFYLIIYGVGPRWTSQPPRSQDVTRRGLANTLRYITYEFDLPYSG